MKENIYTNSLPSQALCFTYQISHNPIFYYNKCFLGALITIIATDFSIRISLLFLVDRDQKLDVSRDI